MIVTAKPKIPFSWIVLAALPWVAMLFKDKLMGAAFAASMKRFVDNPAALSLALVIAPMASWLVPMVVNFYADRIWTRFGRRKPFILVSWCGTITCIFLMPLAPDFPTLVALYVGFVICNDLGGPAEALKMEIVPPAQRPLSTAVVQWINQVGVIVYFWVALGRLDEVTVFLDYRWDGQQGLFWSVALGMLVMLAFLMLGIKETDPKSTLRGKTGFLDFFKGLFSPHVWPLYILTFSQAFTGAGLGVNDYLLLTEQWGYTNQDVGNNIAIGGIINLALIPLIGLIANRTGRFKVYITLIVIQILLNIARYCYYEYAIYDGRPTISEMVFFGEFFSITGILISIALVPLIYDYISRNELGIYAAGSGLVGRASGMLLGFLVGVVFVPTYARWFMAPAGESVRICLREEMRQEDTERIVRAAAWTDPADGKPLDAPYVTARPVYATGAKLDHGYGFEIRVRNEDSEQAVRDARDKADGERAKARARLRYFNGRLEKHPLDLGLQADVDRETAEVARLDAIVAAKEAELQRRADVFKTQVIAVLREQMMVDGSQILDVGAVPAVVATLPLTARPKSEDVEATLDRLRTAVPALIDLRLVAEPSRSIEISIAQAPTQDAGIQARQALLAAATPGLAACLATDAEPATRTATAIRLDLRTLEDPLDRHPSPISQGIEFVLGWMIGHHDPARRLRAIGRGVRRAGWIDHAHASTIGDDDRSLRVTALVGEVPATHRAQPATPAIAATEPTPAAAPAEPAKEKTEAEKQAEIARKKAEADRPKPEEMPSQAVLDRFAGLGEAEAARAAALYAVSVRAAKEGRMTVARPVLQASYSKQQYDYLAGYIGVFVLQAIGVGIILVFVYMVKTGRVTKRGVQEAEATR